MFAYFVKNKLQKWWDSRCPEIRKEFHDKEQELIFESEKYLENMRVRLDLKKKELDDELEIIERRKLDNEDIEKRIEDRKQELLRVNEELKTQIRLIEAKASPDQIWTNAFSQGVSKAWDMMVPIMAENVKKAKETIRNQEIDNSLPRIESVVEQRLRDMGSYDLISAHQLEAKRKECVLKLGKQLTPDDKLKIESYIKILDWVIGVRNGN